MRSVLLHFSPTVLLVGLLMLGLLSAPAAGQRPAQRAADVLGIHWSNPPAESDWNLVGSPRYSSL